MADTDMPDSMDLSTLLQATMGALAPMLLRTKPASGNDRLGEKRQRTETPSDTRHTELPQMMRAARAEARGSASKHQQTGLLHFFTSPGEAGIQPTLLSTTTK